MWANTGAGGIALQRPLKSYESDLKSTLQNETQAQYTHGTLRKGGSKKKGDLKKGDLRKGEYLVTEKVCL